MDFQIILGHVAPLIVIGLVQLSKKIISSRWSPLLVIGLGGLSTLLGVGPKPGEGFVDNTVNVAYVSGLATLIYDVFKKIKPTPAQVKSIILLLAAVSMLTSPMGCAFLKPAGDVKLTEDETARLVVGGFQDASGVLFDAGKMFILAQPQYQGEWKTRIAPCFNQINKFLGGMAAGGSAGLKITPQLVVNQLQTQVMDIVMVYTQWGTVPDAKNQKPTPAQSALIIVAGIQAGTILYDQLVSFSGGKIQTWEAIVVKNAALQAKIDAEK
jgi:hypothetical protein